MKIEDILTETQMYTAYVLDEGSRDQLLTRFPPKYPTVVAHHVTVKFPASAEDAPPAPAKLAVVGYADSGDGLEALVVSVGGKIERPDGSNYHVTWSLDPAKYSPKDSNALVSNPARKFKMILPIQFKTTPELLK